MNDLKLDQSSTSSEPNTIVSDRFNNLTKQAVPTRITDPVEHLVCFSHLRWKFVYQRPQHLLSRASRQWHIWFIEEPIFGDQHQLDMHAVSENLTVVVPHLKHGTKHEDVIRLQREAVDQLLAKENIHDFIAWYYTPMALLFSDHLKPKLTVYDCMDELSAFLGAPPSLLAQEKNLLKKADLVFTGGLSLFEAKQARHPQVFAFPSSIDYHHFEPARKALPEPSDMRSIPKPRIGFCGVIDERIDVNLIREVTQRRSDWQFIFLGPVVKINPATLPNASNIHYLGLKQYNDLPAYFSHWNVAIMPFSINEHTRYISPTKTPEYLAAGLPVVSTPIHDVVSTYGDLTAVSIAGTPLAFEQAIENALTLPHDLTPVDEQLLATSWDTTWAEMNRLMQARLATVFQ